MYRLNDNSRLRIDLCRYGEGKVSVVVGEKLSMSNAVEREKRKSEKYIPGRNSSGKNYTVL